MALNTEVPMVRIEIQGLQQSIIAALSEYEGTLSEALSREVRKFVTDYDYSGAIHKMLPPIMDNMIRRGLEDAIQLSPAGRELRNHVTQLGVEQLEKLLLEMRSNWQ